VHQNTANTDSDCRKVIRLLARLNPHVSLSDIAFLMGVHYELEPGEHEYFETAEQS